MKIKDMKDLKQRFFTIPGHGHIYFCLDVVPVGQRFSITLVYPESFRIIIFNDFTDAFVKDIILIEEL